MRKPIPTQRIIDPIQEKLSIGQGQREGYQMGSYEECQRHRRQNSSPQRVYHLFEDKRDMCEMTIGHPGRVEVRWGGRTKQGTDSQCLQP